MRHNQDSLPCSPYLVNFSAAFLLEGLVADCENFIDEENVRVGLNCGGKRKAYSHPGGKILQLHVLKAFQLGKIEDLFVFRCDHPFCEAHDGAVEIDVLFCGEVWVEPDAKFEEGGDLSVHLDGAAVWVQDSREDLEKRTLAAPIRTNHAECLAVFYGKTYVLERIENLV